MSLIFLLAVLIIIATILILNDLKKPEHFPPGPRWFPLLGSLPAVKSLRSIHVYHHLVWHKLSEQYGPVVGLRLGRNLVVIVTSMEGIREVYTREEFIGRPDGFFFRLRTFGKRLGIIFTDGQVWQKQRKFSLHHLRQFGYGRREMEEQITEEVRNLIMNLEEKCSKPIDLHNLFDVCVLNVLWAMIAGKRFDLEDEKLRELMGIIHDAFRSNDISGGLLNQMPFLRFIAPGKSGYTFLTSIHERMWSFLRETITDHKETLCEAGHARDLIDAFLQKMSYNNKQIQVDTFTDEQLLSLCLDMFMAGSETTSNTLEFIVTYMVRYPDVQRRMQQEMDDVVGRNRRPCLQDRNSLVYVDAVLNEVQRCANVAPVGIAHRAVCDATLFGYKIPKGTTILTNLYSIHTANEFWQDGHVFRPERFLEPGKKHAAQDTYFAPFGYGQRRCLGETLAKSNLFLVTTALFHNFTVSVPEGCPPPSLQGLDGITLSPVPYQICLTPRN